MIYKKLKHLHFFQLAEASAVSHYHENELKQLKAQASKRR